MNRRLSAIRIVLLVIAFIAVLSPAARAGQASFADNILMLGDSTTLSSYPGQNFDNYSDDLDAELWTGRWWGGSADTRSYLKFEMPEALSPVITAYLYLYNGVNSDNVKSANAGGSTFDAAYIGVYLIQGQWTESGINWNNQPEPGVLISASIAGKDTGWYRWDIKDAVISNRADACILFLLGAGAMVSLRIRKNKNFV